MLSSKYLHSHVNSKPFFEAGFAFNYCSVIWKLNYLAQTSRPDIIFAVHQLAQYSADPQKEHGLAVETCAFISILQVNLELSPRWIKRKVLNAMLILILPEDSTRMFLKMTQHVPSLVLAGIPSMQVVPSCEHLNFKSCSK